MDDAGKFFGKKLNYTQGVVFQNTWIKAGCFTGSVSGKPKLAVNDNYFRIVNHHHTFSNSGPECLQRQQQLQYHFMECSGWFGGKQADEQFYR